MLLQSSRQEPQHNLGGLPVAFGHFGGHPTPPHPQLPPTNGHREVSLSRARGYFPSLPVNKGPETSAPSHPPSLFSGPGLCRNYSRRGQVVGDLPPRSPEGSPRSTFLSLLTTNDKVVLPVFHQFKLGIGAATFSRAHLYHNPLHRSGVVLPWV